MLCAGSGLNAEAELPRAFADGVFTVEDRHLPGMFHVGRTIGGGNIGHAFGVDGTDERSLTEALIDGRRRLPEYEHYYREYLPGHERMELVATGALLGIRETRRIQGDYVLCANDFIGRSVFPDEIGRYAYPVDIHASDASGGGLSPTQARVRRFPSGAGRELWRSPIARSSPGGLQNVLVAGRCVSTDRSMQSSIRVMPGCFITGAGGRCGCGYGRFIGQPGA